MTNEQLINLWIDAITSEGLALKSVETYQDDIACYLRYLKAHGLSAATITLPSLRDYLYSLEAYSSATIFHRRAVIGRFHAFLAAEGYASSDPADLLDPMRRGTAIPRTVSIDEVSRLLETAHDRASDTSGGLYAQAGLARRAALLETLYATGCRISEALALQYKDLRNNHAIIVGKGGTERLIMFNDRAREAIEFWRSLVIKYQPGSRIWIFHSTRRYDRPLTRNSAFKEIKDAAIQAGLSNPDRLSPHILRHAFASHLLSNGVDLRALQEMLGHADISSTEIYTHVLDHRKAAMVGDLHPMTDDMPPG